MIDLGLAANVRLGFLETFGAQVGAFASTWSFHENNLIVLGTNEQDMALAANEASSSGGGIAIAKDGKILAKMPLQVGGIISSDPFNIVEKNFASLGDVTITNDGATILKEIDVQHPAAKMMVEISKTVDNEVGDGTTSSVVFGGALLEKAEDLLKRNVHSSVIVEGYQLASEKTLELLQGMAKTVKPDDEEILIKIAKTSMQSKLISEDGDPLSKVVVRAVMSIAAKKAEKFTVDLENIKVEKKAGGSIQDTSLIKGIVLDKEVVHSGMPTRIQNAKIALFNSALEIEKTEISSEIKISDPTQMQMFLDEENRMLKTMVDKLHNAGVNVLLCQKGIDDLAQHYLAKHGIMAVHAKRVKESANMEQRKIESDKWVIHRRTATRALSAFDTRWYTE